MEIHQLEQFKTIAECKTMREAAEKLYLSQPALSQNLKKLEAELGCILFDRSHNQLSMTAYGEILLEHAHRILFDLKEVTEKIEEKNLEEAKVIRIGSFYSPLNLFALPQVANTLPEFKFEVIVDSSEALAKSLIDEKVDLAFLPFQFCPAHLDSFPVFQEDLFLSLSPKSALKDKEVITSQELRQVELIIPDNFPGLSGWYEDAIREAEVPASSVKRMPIREYLERMDSTDMAHFTTSMMSMFSGSGSVRPSIPVKIGVSPRIISVACNAENECARPAIDYIREKQDELISNHAFLPYLLFESGTPNLTMVFSE